MATGKQRRRVAKNGDGEVLIEWLRSKEKPHRSLSRANAKPRVAIGASGRLEKDTGGGAVVVTLFTIFIELPFV